VSGTIKDASNNGLGGIKVTDGNGRTTLTSSNGRYNLLATTGTWTIKANPADASQNLGYTTGESAPLAMVSGLLYDPIDMNLSQGGRIRGYFRTASNTPMPGRVAVALRGGNIEAQGVSDNTGYFYLTNLATGTYGVQPSLDPAEVSSPSSTTVVLATTGTLTNISTFTITSGLSEITGQALNSSSSPITTGVLVLASTVTLTGGSTSPPPSASGSTGVLCNPCTYAASSDATGRFSLDVRSSSLPYKLYGWYTTFNTAGTPTVKRSGPYSVSVSTGGQVIPQNLQW
jgi:hypothetical protein